MLLHVLTFLLSAVLLWRGAEWIVDSASAMARRFGVSELVIGLTVVAMGTSAPEFLVTGMAAFKGLSDISLSNVVGSNVFNLGFILGLMALIRPLATNPTVLYRDGLLLLATCASILLMALAGVLGRPAGLALLLLLAGYVGFLLWRGSRKQLHLEALDEVVERPMRWWDPFKLLAGFAAVAVGGDLMVETARTMAQALGVSDWVIGMTIVAAGTSLPELVTCLAAALKGKSDMLLGNLIGSDIFNFAGVLGLTCLLRPLNVSDSALPGLMVLVSMVALVLVLMRTGWKIRRWEGALLIALNLGRWAWDFLG